MVQIHNLETGAAAPLSDGVITSEHILLFPGESAQELADLQARWTKEFPGHSQSRLTLRHDLIRADWNARRARVLLSHLQLELHLTGLPSAAWNRVIQNQLQFHQKNLAHAQREFRKALQLIQSLKTSEPPSEPPAADKPPIIEAPRIKPSANQHFTVKVTDGQVLTDIDNPNETFLDPAITECCGRVWRHFHFENGNVPEPYQFVLEDEGTIYPPAKTFSIAYALEEFQRLCRLEIEAASPIPLDGAREDYKRQKELTDETLNN